MLTKPFIGIGYFIKGLKLLTAPGIKRYVIIPLTVNFFVFGLLIWAMTDQFGTLLDTWLPTLPNWLAWLNWLIWVVFVLAVALVLFFSFSIVANIIAAPFNGLLAEAIERHLTGFEPPGGEGFFKALRDAPSAIMDELRKLGYFAAWSIPLLILFWIPGINLAAPFLWAVFSAWMLAVEYTDYPMGNHGLKSMQQRQLLRQNRLTSLGFGGIVLMATMTPVLNFLIMPAAVAGATVYWTKKLNIDGE